MLHDKFKGFRQNNYNSFCNVGSTAFVGESSKVLLWYDEIKVWTMWNYEETAAEPPKPHKITIFRRII